MSLEENSLCNINDEYDEVSDIILIGDAPPNTEEEIQWKRKTGKESYMAVIVTVMNYIKKNVFIGTIRRVCGSKN